MNTTVNEKVGDIILGTHLVHCHHDTRFNKAGNLVLVRNPLLSGRGNVNQWTKKETKPGGWHREITMKLETDATDPTRATSQFKVLSVRAVPVVTGSFMGRDDGYGGGVDITVKRLDGKGERIRYHRGGCWGDTITEPAILVTP